MPTPTAFSPDVTRDGRRVVYVRGTPGFDGDDKLVVAQSNDLANGTVISTKLEAARLQAGEFRPRMIRAARFAPGGAEILVERLVKGRALRAGTFPFGRQAKGKRRLVWPVSAGGKRLKAGSYRITLRALDSRNRPIELTRPVDISVAKSGRVKVVA